MERLRKVSAFVLFIAWLSTVALFIKKLPELPTQVNWLLLLGLGALLAWGTLKLLRTPLPKEFTLTQFYPIQLNLTPLALILLVAGLSLSLVSQGLHIRFDFSAATITTDIATVTYLIGLLVLSIGVLLLATPVRTKGSSLTRWELVGLILLLLIGVFLRVYHLDSIGHLPEDSLWMDQAFLVLNRTIRSPFLFIGDLSTNAPGYIVALVYALTHNMSLAVRLPSVLYALLFHVALFFLVKETLGKKVAFWALMLATFSIWDVHTSRLAWLNLTTTPVLITSIILFLVRALKYHSPWDIYLCGVASGIAFNLLYIPAMMVGIVIVFYWGFALWEVVRRRGQILFHLKRAVGLFTIFSLSFLLVVGPTIVKIFRYPQTLERHEDFVAQNVQRARQGDNLASYYLLQFTNALSAFGYNPDHYRSDGPWGPALNPVIVFFYHVGLVAGLASFGAVVFPLFFFTWTGLYVPVVFLYITGSVWRLIAFAPLVFLFAAYGIHLCVRVLESFVPHRLAPVANWGLSALTVLLLGYFVREEFAQYYYMRTNEAQNHIFQLCKTVEGKIDILSPTIVFVDDSWCGQTLATVFSGRIRVLYYDGVALLATQNIPRGSVILKTQARNVLGSASDMSSQFEASLALAKYLSVVDEKADQQIDIYTVQ